MKATTTKTLSNLVFLIFFWILSCSPVILFGQLHYTDTTFYKNGSIENYAVQNHEDSTWTRYCLNRDQKVCVEAHLMRDGYTKHGQYLAYYDNHDLETFTMAYLNGHVVEYYPNGKVKFEGQFYNGFKSGTWKEYSWSGKILTKTTYELSKNDSIATEIVLDHVDKIAVGYYYPPQDSEMEYSRTYSALEFIVGIPNGKVKTKIWKRRMKVLTKSSEYLIGS